MESELDQYVVNLFNQHADTVMQSLDQLAPQIADCSTLIVQALLSENKVLCCGEGQNGSLAQIFASNLLNRFDYERPSLPAIALGPDATAITAITSDGSFNEIFSKQIRALGQPNDLLIIFSNGTSSGTTVEAVKAAIDREMITILIADQDYNNMAALMSSEDVILSIPSNNRARVVETQLLVINCLCELIDQQLFGGEN